MSYQIILLDEAVNIMHITCGNFKQWKLWRVEFHDGKEAVLFKCRNEWMQRIEDRLDLRFLLLIGQCIDNGLKTNVGIAN